MRTVEVPLFGKVIRNVDEFELDEFQARLFDGFLDELGFTRSRPGLFLKLDLSPNGALAPILGLWWWPNKQWLICVTSNKVFRIDFASGGLIPTDITGSSTLSASNRPTFTTDGTYVFIANGGKINYSDGTTGLQPLADADAPTSVTQLAYLDGYLLANNSNNRFHWSNVNSSLVWDALDFASAARNPDNIAGLKVFRREILLFGDQTLETWENDGESPFSPTPGGLTEYGCLAPNSIVATESRIYWMDDERHFVYREAGGEPKRISSPYDRELVSFAGISDCQAEHLDVDGQTFVLFSFLTADRTLVYNEQADDWHEWGAFSSSLISYSRFRANAYAYCPTWGVRIAGAKDSAKLYYLSTSYHSDDGQPIRLARTTGNISHGTLKRKRNHELRLRVKRGETGTSTEPTMMLRWRDNGRSEWSQEKSISLGNPGETDLVRRLTMTGIYRTRQYELSATDAVTIAFGKAEEDIEDLAR